MSKPPKRRLPPTVGTQLRAARLRQHRTLPDLAEALGASKGSLSGVETGAFAPSRLPRLMAWAKALGLDPLELAIQAHGERAPREIRSEVRRRLQSPLLRDRRSETQKANSLVDTFGPPEAPIGAGRRPDEQAQEAIPAYPARPGVPNQGGPDGA